MIEDCDTIDIVQHIIGLFSEELGLEEDRVITAGTGVGQPTGYSSGGLGIQCQAVAGNLGFDDIIDLIYLLPAKYRNRPECSFFVHKNNVRELRKVKDSNNRYIWMDSPAPGQPSTIYGYLNWMPLSVVKLIEKTVNCWKTLTLKARAISSQAQRVIFGKVQRLATESC